MQHNTTTDTGNDEIKFGIPQCPVVMSAQALMLIALMCDEKEPDTSTIQDIAKRCLSELEVDTNAAVENGRKLLSHAEESHPPVENTGLSNIAAGLEIMVENMAGYYDINQWPQSPVAVACRSMAVARTRLLQIA